MGYKTCSKCGGSNKSSASKCYSCGDSFIEQAAQREMRNSEPLISREERKAAFEEASKSMVTAFLAVTLSTIAGGAMGYGLSVLEFELPFFLEEIGLGVICAVATAYCIGKFQDMPEGLLLARLGPAALYGASVGLCLFMVWYSFDPSAGFPVIGMIAGFCTGVPICVSFGLAGGESRPVGRIELMNFGVSMGVGVLMGLWVCMDDGDFYMLPGVMGALGLIPTIMGGRVNLAELMEYFPQSRYD